MPSLRMLSDTVTLYNFVGEVDDVATYQKAIISRCYCSEISEIYAAKSGSVPNGQAKLYIFDRGSRVTDSDGNFLSYLPQREWDKLEDKTGYWTLKESPTKDYFIKSGSSERRSVIRFAHLTGGTPRMWHFEVTGA